MNLLDRAISVFSPQRGLARVKARHQIRRLGDVQNIYEAASRSRRTQHWRAAASDANAEISAAMVRVREVSRDLVRNNAFAARAKMTIESNVVGAGIVPRIRTENEQARELMRAHLESTAIDAAGRHNLYGLQSLALATVVEAGEVLIRRRPRRPEDKLPLPFQLEILEPDYLDTTKDGKLDSGNVVVNGVEFDGIGRRVAYWIFPEHPGAVRTGIGGSYRSFRVAAESMIHLYRVDRPGQVRGISWFAPVVVRLADFKDFVDAQLVRQKVAACFAAFITTEESIGEAESGQTFPVEELQPGMVERLREGESVTFAQPPQVGDFGEYSRATLREIAAGLGITYEALTGDLSGVNFSSGRMGWIEFARNVDAWRWNMLVPQMCEPIARWAADAAQLQTKNTTPIITTWTPPAREMIDPAKEIEAMGAAQDLGLRTRSENIRSLGYDPTEVDQEFAEEKKREKSLGLAFGEAAKAQAAKPAPAAPPAD